MQELLVEYRKLQLTKAERDEIKKKIRARIERLENRALSRFASLDDEIEKLRQRIREEMGEEARVEFDDAMVEVVRKRNVTIVDRDAVAAWLRAHNKSEIIKPLEFDKRNLNKIALTLDEIGQSVDGTQVKDSEELRITLRGE